MRMRPRLVGMVMAVVASLVVTAGPASAAAALAAVPSFPSSVSVGSTGLSGAVTVTNVSFGPQGTESLALSTITLVPSCGTMAFADSCPAPSVDPGVFQLASTATGRVGTACPNMFFSVVTVDGAQGKVQFVPSSTVTLSPPGGGTDSCVIDFTFSVPKPPSKDASPNAGLQTAQLAAATGTTTGSSLSASGIGSGLTTVAISGRIDTHVSAVESGGALNLTDTATVTGPAGGPPPTGTVSFTYFRDAPGAAPCSGPSSSAGVGPMNPGPQGSVSGVAGSASVAATGPATYRFVATYSGDANYPGIPTTLCGSTGESVDVPASGRFTPLTPARILDTRDGTGGIAGPVGPGATVSVQVTGRGGVPASGVSAVAMNVTVTQPTADGFLTLFPTGEARPLAANLNFSPGKTVPNLVVVKLGTGGKVDMFNSAGSTHVIYDVAGWFSTVPAGNDGRYQALTPARILDTRDGTGGSSVRLGPGASLDLQVAGVGGVPAAGAEAVVMNVAVTNTTATSFLTVYPAGQARPLAANLNWVAANTVGNRVVAKLDAGGRVTIYNNAGLTDVIVDVNGWFSNASVTGSTGTYSPLTPARILDTRDGTGGVAGPRAAGSTVDVQVTGQGGVPAGASAVILNATVVGPAAAGFLTLFPTGTARPLASDLNYAAGEVRPNLVVVKVGTGGKVSLYTPSSTHVVFDVAGYMS